MGFCKNKKRIILSLLGIVFGICFTACTGQTSQKEASAITQQTSRGENSSASYQNESDITIPEEITMELFGMNLLEINRPMWEKYIYSIYDEREDDGMGISFPIGNYEVMHSYLNFENKKNFSASITYNNNFGASQILFDENDKLLKIDIRNDMGEEFSTSFLNIGDNVKNYFESSEKGLWDKFLKGETIVASQGWNVRRSTVSAPEDTYDDLQIFNKDIYISYLIKDEVVDYIIVNVIGDIVINESEETKPSIYDLDVFEFYIDGKAISKMSGSDWVNAFSDSFEDVWREFFKFSEKNSKYGDYRKEAQTIVDGLKVWVNYTALEDHNWMAISTESVSKLKNDIYTEDRQPCQITFMLTKDGYYNINLWIHGESSLITGNYIMPGDNIRTFLNSYEDGLYEKIMSLSDDTEEYSIGPYCFRYLGNGESEENAISIRKRDERNSSAVEIGFHNEIVTWISRGYSGTVSGFEEEPSLW